MNKPVAYCTGLFHHINCISMKTKIYSIVIAIAAAFLYNNSNAQSNKSLSNLTAPTAINQSLLPDINNSKELGSSLLGWKNIYLTSRIYLDKKVTLQAPGTGNFFIGSDAGKTALTGSYNTAIGQFALSSITSGNGNTVTGYSSLFNNTSGRDNTGIGYTSLYFNTTGSFNTATGSWALNKNETGSNNTAYGYSALWQNQTGNDNTALGKYSMYSNTRGFSNVAIGTMALFKSVRNNNTVAIGDSALYNFTGDLFTYESYTTAVGSKSLFNATSGYENTAIGTRAMFNTTKGSINTAVGVSALFQNTEGVFNTAIGVTALSGNTTGKHNTGVGYSTLQINKTGSQNTAIGSYAGPNSFDLVSNSTSVGYLSRATASNQVRLGNTDVTSIGGQVGWTIFSDGRYKRNIKENIAGLAFINSLRPVSYTVDTKKLREYFMKGIKKLRDDEAFENDKSTEASSKIIYDGFVAQEVEEAANKLNFQFSGVDKPAGKDGLYGLRYDNFVVPLVKAVQELSKQNDSLKAQNESLEKRIERMEALLNNQSALNGKQLAVLSSASLEQNTPNPFSNTTAINYVLPAKFNNAAIVIVDMNGKTVKQIKLTATGKGVLQLDAPALASGIYTYSLIVDGKSVGSKKMIINK